VKKENILRGVGGKKQGRKSVKVKIVFGSFFAFGFVFLSLLQMEC